MITGLTPGRYANRSGEYEVRTDGTVWLIGGRDLPEGTGPKQVDALPGDAAMTSGAFESIPRSETIPPAEGPGPESVSPPAAEIHPEATPELRSKPASELMDDALRRTQESLQSAARASEEIHELERRAQEAMDWRRQLSRHPWLPLGVAAGVAVLAYLVFGPRRS